MQLNLGAHNSTNHGEEDYADGTGQTLRSWEPALPVRAPGVPGSSRSAEHVSARSASTLASLASRSRL